MKRREFLKKSLLISGVTVVSGSAIWINVDTNDKALTVSSALELLKNLNGNLDVIEGEWDLAQIFNHCAQSIEYSMSEYPEQKSKFFKKTVGRLAFSVFNSKGQMTHDLNEPIPGAGFLTPGQDYQASISRLRSAFEDFNAFTGNLASHFAYGDLTKIEYEKAHVMHFYNHLLALNV